MYKSGYKGVHQSFFFKNTNILNTVKLLPGINEYIRQYQTSDTSSLTVNYIISIKILDLFKSGFLSNRHKLYCILKMELL